MSRRSIWSEAGSRPQRPNRNYVSHRGDVQEDCLAPFVVNKSAGGRGQVMGLPFLPCPQHSGSVCSQDAGELTGNDFEWMCVWNPWPSPTAYRLSVILPPVLQQVSSSLIVKLASLTFKFKFWPWGWEIYLPRPSSFYTVDVQDFHFTTEWSWLQCFFHRCEKKQQKWVCGKKNSWKICPTLRWFI